MSLTVKEDLQNTRTFQRTMEYSGVHCALTAGDAGVARTLRRATKDTGPQRALRPSHFILRFHITECRYDALEAERGTVSSTRPRMRRATSLLVRLPPTVTARRDARRDAAHASSGNCR